MNHVEQVTITDLLLIVGAGLVVGRNASVLKYYYQEKDRKMEENQRSPNRTRFSIIIVGSRLRYRW